MDVSTLIIKSRFSISAAVSANSFNSWLKSTQSTPGGGFLRGGFSLLQAVESNPRQFHQRMECFQTPRAEIDLVVHHSAPDKADAQLAVAGHFGGEIGGAIFGGVEVGDFVGNIVQRDPENPRQALQWQMIIELRQPLAACDQFVHAGDSLKKGHQGGLAFEHESAAALRDHRNEANEIHGIAQSSFGMEKDGFAGWVRAVPLRLGKTPIQSHLLVLQAPFEIFPSFAQSPKLEQDSGAAPMKSGIIRLAFNRPGK